MNFLKELLPTGNLVFIVFCVLPCTEQQVRSFDILRFKQQLYVHVLIENNRYIKSFHKKRLFSDKVFGTTCIRLVAEAYLITC